MLYYDVKDHMIISANNAENIATNLSNGRYAKLGFCGPVNEDEVINDFLIHCHYPQYFEELTNECNKS